MTDLKRTPLHALHVSLGARMGPFAGFDMPIAFPEGTIREHLHTRAAAGLFDVSHMGQIALRPRSGTLADAARALESLTPANVLDLPEGRQRYLLFTSEAGGVLDDAMVANRGDHLLLVVNAANAAADAAHLQAAIGDTVAVEPLDRGLLALQGPAAEAVLARHHADVRMMRFMDVWPIEFHGVRAVVARSGYTGEDGFEISLPERDTLDFARWLLDDERVRCIGLAARDTLRLEAGLCLHGQDIDAETSPVEAALDFAVAPARRAGGARAGGFPGAARILDELARGPARRRVMLLSDGRAFMRAGVELFAAEDGPAVGVVTSGGFGPTLEAPVAMGYVEAAHAAPGTALLGRLRGKMQPVKVAAAPLVKPGYKRG